MRDPARGAAEPGGGLPAILAEAWRLCPGTEDALLVDSEGVLVARRSRERAGVDHDEVAVEAVGSVPALGRVAVAARLGGVHQVVLVGERGILVVERVHAQALYVVLRVSSSEWTGRARFAARVVAGKVADRL